MERNKMIIGVDCNFAAHVKLLLAALLFVSSIITVVQLLPPNFNLTANNLPNSTSNISSTTLAAAVQKTPQSPPPIQSDQVIDGGVIKRSFKPVGVAAYNYILMSAYRVGLDTFAVMGLSSKPLQDFGRPTYECEWVPANSTASEPSVTTTGYKILPDWGFGRFYSVVVVNCTFPIPVGDDGSGGKLLLHASTNGGGDRGLNAIDTIEALTEEPGSVNPSYYTTAPPKYDYLYCGSPLFGDLSPQRIREWLAYHVRLFGEKSHFVIQDAGGVHPEVLEVVRPWMEKGFVTLQDIRDEERFDGYYHNQFLIVSDCLNRYKFDAKWIFFFDVDEYVYIPKNGSIKSVTDSLSEYTRFTFPQMRMSSQLCMAEDAGKTYRKWGMEKLVYRDVTVGGAGPRRDRKYAVQPRNVFATGIHISQNLNGQTIYTSEDKIKYYHYHDAIAYRKEPCRQLLNFTNITIDEVPYKLDTTMREAAAAVKRFELETIGPQRIRL